MPRYTIDVPRTWNEKVLEIAEDEDVPVATLLAWLLKAEITDRLRSIARSVTEATA